MEVLINLFVVVLLLTLGFVAGSIFEAQHFKSIKEREEELRNILTTNLKSTPADRTVHSSAMVYGSVVVSLDYFKRFLAGFRALVGGRMGSYESLLERARREAILRMKSQAKAQGFEAIINTRLETSRMANINSQKQGVGGVEILAYGTAIRFQ